MQDLRGSAWNSALIDGIFVACWRNILFKPTCRYSFLEPPNEKDPLFDYDLC